jgi:diguanylate cyclase (GGDEF)-like protein/PAS domain S-box-containing protein
MSFWRLVSPDHFNTPGLLVHHNLVLAFVAFLLAALVSMTFKPVMQRYSETNTTLRAYWLVAGSVAMGVGLWAMHFTALLSYHVHHAIVRYDTLLTIVSVVPAILSSAVCIALAERARHNLYYRHLLALTLALGLGGMHYLGLEGLHIYGAERYYEPVLFWLGWGAAYSLIWIGLSLYVKQLEQQPNRLRLFFANVLLGLSLLCTHFVYLQSLYFQPAFENAFFVQHQAIPIGLAASIFLIVSTFLILFFIGTVVGKRLSHMAHSLEMSEGRFQNLAQSSQSAIFTFDDRVITYANPALSKKMGYPHEQIVGQTIEQVLGEDFKKLAERLLSQKGHDAFYQEFPVVTLEGATKWLYFSVCLTECEQGQQGLATAVDITKQKRAEMHMRDLAYTDLLTKLGNRASFIMQLSKHLNAEHQPSPQISSAVMHFDLDSFKSINDVNGHAFGDRLLIEVADRLNSFKKPSMTIARIGGDEFILLIEQASDSRELFTAAQALFTHLSSPYEIDGHVLSLGISMGVLMITPDYRDADQVLHDVDVALYRAKQEHEGCWMLFDEHLDAKTKRARLLLPELSDAIIGRTLQFFYQPIVDADTHEIKGFEALARWQRDNGEWVSPAEFIPLAENSGLIAGIGLWGIEAAARQLNEWCQRDKAFRSTYISVNIAALSFSDERLYQQIASLFDVYGIQPGQIRLELTERTLVDEPKHMAKKLNQLRSLGCDLMIDDFGTGYSSLSYLHLLPISTIKIDRSFVVDLTENDGAETVVRTIISLAENLSMNIVAEGVETKEQAQKLCEMGVDMLQGYYFAKPIEANQVAYYVNKKTSLVSD